MGFRAGLVIHLEDGCVLEHGSGGIAQYNDVLAWSRAAFGKETKDSFQFEPHANPQMYSGGSLIASRKGNRYKLEGGVKPKKPPNTSKGQVHLWCYRSTGVLLL